MNWTVNKFLFFIGLFLLLGCYEPSTVANKESLFSPVAAINPEVQLIAPTADGFDFPVGPPDAKQYYNAQVFGKNLHLGDDWNGRGGGNTDLGDPVHAIARGIVVVAEDFGGGWGNVIRVIHNIGTATEPQSIESLYAHLDTIAVDVGDTIGRGEEIGKIGNAGGLYFAHLHMEIRDSIGMPLGGGYSNETAGFVDPTAFINSHRPD